jgi:hypothetical protein
MSSNTGQSALRLELDPESAFASGPENLSVGLVVHFQRARKNIEFLVTAAIRPAVFFYLLPFF